MYNNVQFNGNTRWRKTREEDRINIWNSDDWEFPKLMADTKPQIWEAQKMPSMIIPKGKKTKRLYLNKAERKRWKWEAKTTYQQRNKDTNYIRLLFRKHTSKKREWSVLNVSGEEAYKSRILYPMTSFIKSKGGIITFSDKQILRELIASSSAMKEILEGLQREGKWHRSEIQVYF